MITLKTPWGNRRSAWAEIVNREIIHTIKITITIEILKDINDYDYDYDYEKKTLQSITIKII